MVVDAGYLDQDQRAYKHFNLSEVSISISMADFIHELQVATRINEEPFAIFFITAHIAILALNPLLQTVDTLAQVLGDENTLGMAMNTMRHAIDESRFVQFDINAPHIYSIEYNPYCNILLDYL